jgi:hypothetical protein
MRSKNKLGAGDRLLAAAYASTDASCAIPELGLENTGTDRAPGSRVADHTAGLPEQLALGVLLQLAPQAEGLHGQRRVARLTLALYREAASLTRRGAAVVRDAEALIAVDGHSPFR